jgi:SAM-dependent methyltransferase
MPKETNIHFDALAASYDEQMPPHIREYLLAKKTGLTVATLKRYGIPGGKGIDLGCGTGWYLKSICESGYRMTGVDNSASQILAARRNNEGNTAVIQSGDILHLAFDDSSFDFAYCINSLHHLKDDAEFGRALGEIHRILRPGGLLVIHELNAFLLFKIYLNYIFPLTNKIDRFGGENWVSPNMLSEQGFFTVKEVSYYTFFPHIIPKALFSFFLRINGYMEKVFFRKIGVHYMAVLKK